MKLWMMVIASYIVTLVLYMLAKTQVPAYDYTQVVVQMTGLLGIVSLGWSFVLSLRHRILEKWFGGLDLVYRIHHIVGGMSLILLLQHPLFLIIGELPLNRVVFYLVPGLRLDYTLGQLALYFMIFLLALTFYVPLPYRYWKWSHEWMGIVMILGALHSFLVSSDTTTNPLIMIWIAAWSVIAILSYIYKRFVYYLWQNKATYVVERIEQMPQMYMMRLRAEGSAIDFEPGEFGFFSFSARRRDDHAFSIWESSGNTLTIGVKILANFTRELSKLSPGFTLEVRGPFGTFAQKIELAQHAVFVAGGIGITPFNSMLKIIKPTQRVEMFFCARVMPPNILTDPFVAKANSSENFKFAACETSKMKRLSAQDIYEQSGKDLKAYYFLCGPKEMMVSIATELVKIGVRRSRVIYEDFGFK